MATLSPTELKGSIQAALGNFASLPIPAATRNLFSILGYTSPRDESILRISTVDDFLGWLAGAGKLDLLSAKDQNDLHTALPGLHFLFQLTDDEIKAAIGPAQASLFDSGTTVDGSRIHSYLIFAAQLATDAPRTRTALVRLVRLINKPLPMPALILFRQGDRLTIADFAVGVTLPYAEKAQIPVGSFPEVVRWHDRLNELPAWREPFPVAKTAAAA